MQMMARLVLPFLIGFATFVGIAAPNVITRLERQQPVTVLLYNHITPELPQDATFGERYYYVLQRDFKEQIGLLKERGFTFITYDDYKKIEANEKVPPKLPLLIAFRDANKDIEIHGLHILKEENVPAVVFYQPNSRGKEKFLTEPQIQHLEANKVAVVDADFSLLRGEKPRMEISGILRLGQFEEHLPHRLYNSWLSAIGIGFFCFLVAALSMLFPRVSLLLPILLLPMYMIRFTVFGVPATLLELVLTITILGTIVTQWYGLKAAVKDFPYLMAALLFLVSAIIATLFAQDKMAALGGLKAFVLEPIAYALVIFYWLKKDIEVGKQALASGLLWAYIVTSVIVSLLALKNYLLNNAYINFHLERLATYFGNPNYLGSMLAVAIVLGFYFLLFSRTMVSRGFALSSLLLLIPTFYLTKSDTATVGIGTAVGLLLLYRFMKLLHLPKWLPLVYTTLAIFSAAALFLVIMNYRISPTLERIGAATVLSRAFIYQASIKIIRESPVVGVGLLNYNREFIEHVDPLSPEQNVALAHNTMLDFWTQMGFIGLVAYLWLIIRFFRIAFLTLAWEKEPSRSIMVALVAAMVAIVMHGMLDSQYHKNDYSVFFWLIIALSTIPFIEPKKS